VYAKPGARASNWLQQCSALRTDLISIEFFFAKTANGDAFSIIFRDSAYISAQSRITFPFLYNFIVLFCQNADLKGQAKAQNLGTSHTQKKVFG
jgi:hypothetical protein